MFKSLVISLAKKCALNAIRDAIKAKRETVVYWCDRIDGWLTKIMKVTVYLRSLRDKLANGELTEEEARQAIEETKLIAIEVTRK